MVDLKIENAHGVMKSKSILDVRMRVLASRLGPLAHLTVPCHVLDMPDPIVLKLSASQGVSGARLSFYLSDSSAFE